MEDIKMENELKLYMVKKENLRKTMEKISSYGSDLLIFNLQWRDLEGHLQVMEAKFDKRFKEVVSKEVELQNTSSALEERVKVFDAAVSELGDLETKAAGFQREIEEKSEELDCMRKKLEECTVEQISKAGQLNEMVESLIETQVALEERVKVNNSAVADLETNAARFQREIKEKSEELDCMRKTLEECTVELNETIELRRKTQVALDLKAEQLVQVETDLERHRGELSAEEEHLDRTQTRGRELDEEIERKTKDLSLVLDKIAECEKLFETRSSELVKTRGEIELKGKQLEQVKTDLERHSGELSAEVEHLDRTQTHRRELDEEIKRKTKDLSLVLVKFAECEKLFETRSLELVKTQDEIELKGKQLEQMNIDFERHRGEVSAEMDHLDRSRTCNRELEEEIESKRTDLTAVLNKIAECGEQLELVEKQLDSQQKLLETWSLELASKEKELVGLNLDLDLREHTVSLLNNELESKAKELDDIERLIEDRRAQNESIKLLFEEHIEKLASKEKKQNAITEAIRKLSLEIVSKEKTLERAKIFIQELSEKKHSKLKRLESTERDLERTTADYDSKKKELCSVEKKYREYLEKLKIKEGELNSLQPLITERNQQVEEGEKKKQHLENSIEELIRQLQVKQKGVCSINKVIRECSDKLESKEKHLDHIQSSITNLTAELKSKECNLNSVKKKIHDSLKDFQYKEEQQVILKASLIKRQQELGLKEKQSDTRSEKIELKEKELDAREEQIDKKDQLLKSAKQKLDKCVKDYELNAKKLSSFIQQSSPDQHVDLVQDANVRDEKTLQLLLHGHLKKCHQLHLDVSRALKASSDPAKLVLDTIQGLHQRMAVTKLDPNNVRRSSICLLESLMHMSREPSIEVQGEAIKSAIEWKNTTLVKAENPVEVLGFLHFLAAFSLVYTFDADKVQNLFDVDFLRKYAPSLCEALGVSSLAPVNNVLSLNDMPERLPREAPISNRSDSPCPDVQENIASSHLANKDVLTDVEGSTSFSPNEVFNGLQYMNDPGKDVLNSVSDELKGAQQRGELGLAEPIVKVLVSLLEELPRVVSPREHLQSEALKVAHRWSRMMGTSAQMSPLEALCFLQFIVAYGLVLDRDKILQFASHVTCFKQAPKLFESLGLYYAIPDLVRQLLNERHYIPAIRYIFFFNLNDNFSPLELLKEEIDSLRRSAKEKRRFDSQDEDRDAGRLRDIIELNEDFKMEINLPLDLIVKFMVPRELQNQNQHVVSSSFPIEPPQVHMQASHTVIRSSYIATHSSNSTFPTSIGASPNQQVIDLETYQAGGSTVFQAQSSHQTGFKRPRVDPFGPRAAIRPCFNPSGYGRF